MFEFKPDYERTFARFEAWWRGELIDRPLASMSYPQARIVGPSKAHADPRERWMDTEHIVESTVFGMSNTVFCGDSLPVAMPNLGPNIFAAFYGCAMEFGEDTTWTKPRLCDWSPESLDSMRLDMNSEYFKKIMEITDALIGASQGRFIVGYTDFHPGGDVLAAFRDPQELLMDLLLNPDAVKALCDRVTDDFLRVYDLFHAKFTAAGMPSTTWLNAVGVGKMHVPSNDFSCMISEDDFRTLFLPGIIRECRHMDRCIYHLDGPQALRFLDMLLEIPEIHAIQWVPGAGKDTWSDWIEVYQRIQRAGKSLQIVWMPAKDIPAIRQVLKPNGVWIGGVAGVDNADDASWVERELELWALGR